MYIIIIIIIIIVIIIIIIIVIIIIIIMSTHAICQHAGSPNLMEIVNFQFFPFVSSANRLQHSMKRSCPEASKERKKDFFK